MVLLALMWLGGHDWQSPAKEMLFTLLGVLGTGWATIIGYYFGSSASSAQKTHALTDAALQKTPPPARTAVAIAGAN